MNLPLTTSNPAVLKSMLEHAKGVIIYAGAGMSVEFGIPTYWTGPNAKYADERSIYGYTALEHASGILWESDPVMQEKYYVERSEIIMAGFANHAEDNSYTILRDFLKARNTPHFVVTSNIDGAFEHFGFDKNSIYEVHGSQHFAQCLEEPVEHGIFTNTHDHKCPTCGYMTRPNTLFFDDFAFNPARETSQAARYHDFIDRDLNGYIILEVGVGVTVPRIRDMATRLYYEDGLRYLHVNPQVDAGSNFSQLAVLMGKPRPLNNPEAWLTMGSRDAMLSLNQE